MLQSFSGKLRDGVRQVRGRHIFEFPEAADKSFSEVVLQYAVVNARLHCGCHLPRAIGPVAS